MASTDVTKETGQEQAAGGESGAAPSLADGIELVGRYEDSGFKEPPYIVRRADGQVIQLPELLYRLAEQIDGTRGFDELGERLTQEAGVGVDGEGVKLLVEKKLKPLGVVAGGEGAAAAQAQAQAQAADPLLGLKFKTGVVPERVTWALTTIFKPLFFPPVVIAVVAGFLALEGWLLFGHGVAQPTRELLYNPALLLMVLGAIVLATAFHEIGHASACRYGGATPGKMGAGIYVVWPVFYTDVTDAYRLDRGGRLRTDLGGIYFNAIFALVVGGAYFATSFEPLLVIVLIQVFAMLQQLMPFLRLDGYYVISDLTGVPDMFSRIKPTLRSMLPGRGMDDSVKELKPWVRRAVATYVAVLIPAVLFMFTMLILQAPRIFATGYDSVGLHWDKASAAFDDSDTLLGVGNLLQAAALVLPAVGLVLTSGRVGNRLARGAWSWSEGEPARRAALAATAVLGAGLAAYVWWPNGDYKPIQPGERGTLAGAVSSIGQIPGGRPALTPERERELGGAPTERDRLRGEDPVPASGSSEDPAGEESRDPGTQEGGAETQTQTTPEQQAAPFGDGTSEGGTTTTESPPPSGGGTVEPAPGDPAYSDPSYDGTQPPPEGQVTP